MILSMLYHLSLQSSNIKTGRMPVSTTSSESCPNSCPFKGSGCYAGLGALKFHWRAVDRGSRGNQFEDFCKQIEALPENQIWRHNQAGDLPGKGNRIDVAKLRKLVEANKGKRGFTYTHKPMTKTNQKAVKEANEKGFTINLSADSLDHADKLASLEIAPVAVVVPYDQKEKAFKTPQGRKVVVCPATYKEGVTCHSCQLCQKKRSAIVAFPAHGIQKKKVSAIVG